MVKELTISLVMILVSMNNAYTKSFEISDLQFRNGIYTYNQRRVTGSIIDHYKNGQIKLEYSVLEGRLHGEAIEYYPTGEVKEKRNYILGKLFGEFIVYFKDGSQHVEMDLGLNRYGEGEIIKEFWLAKKPGRKPKNKGNGYLIFYSPQGIQLSNSETLSIQNQSNFKVFVDEKTIYDCTPVD